MVPSAVRAWDACCFLLNLYHREGSRVRRPSLLLRRLLLPTQAYRVTAKLLLACPSHYVIWARVYPKPTCSRCRIIAPASSKACLPVSPWFTDSVARRVSRLHLAGCKEKPCKAPTTAEGKNPSSIRPLTDIAVIAGTVWYGASL